MDSLLVTCSNCKLPLSHRCAEDGRVYVVTGMDAPDWERSRATPVRPIVFETYLDEATLASAKQKLAKLAQYQPLRIARLVFIDDEDVVLNQLRECELALRALLFDRPMLAAKTAGSTTLGNWLAETRAVIDRHQSKEETEHSGSTD